MDMFDDIYNANEINFIFQFFTRQSFSNTSNAILYYKINTDNK